MAERVDIRLLRKDGEIVWVNHSQRWRDRETGALRVVGTVRDITDRVAATEGIASRRTSATCRRTRPGTLAGGVAHDFHNLLYVVIGTPSSRSGSSPRTRRPERTSRRS